MLVNKLLFIYHGEGKAYIKTVASNLCGKAQIKTLHIHLQKYYTSAKEQLSAETTAHSSTECNYTQCIVILHSSAIY